jgi:DNA repair exonuclease SbcCD ATPase subunit
MNNEEFQKVVIDELKGLGQKVDGVESKLSKRIDGVESKLSKRIDGVESKLSKRIDGVESKLSGRIGGVESRLDGVESRLGGVESRLGGIQGRLDGVECGMKGLESKLTEKIDAVDKKHGNRFKAIEEKLDAVYNQTAVLTEFKTEMKEFKAETNMKLDSLIETNRAISGMLGEHEVTLRTMRRIPITKAK